jgi:hypothetical protein
MHIFDIDQLPDVPAPGQHATLLTARTHIDVATCAAARTAMLDAATTGDALVLDLTHAFVDVVAVRDLVTVAERTTHTGRSFTVVGAPTWLVDLAARLDMPPLRFTATVAEAVSALCAAATGRDRPHVSSRSATVSAPPWTT